MQTMSGYKIPGLHEIIKSIIRDNHPIIRQIALSLSERLMHLDRIWVLNQLTHDTSARIRLECLRSLSNEPTESCIEDLMNALLDKSESVRRFAQWKLKDLGEQIDYRQLYSDRISNGSNAYAIAAAVDALGEVGKPQDAVLLLSLMLDKSVIVRKSAIKTIARLDAINHLELFEQQLQNESAGVSRAACNALLSKAKSITLPRSEDLWKIFSSSQFLHVKINVLRLLYTADLWDRIAYCLLASASNNQLLSAISVNHLKLVQKHYFSTLAFTKPSNKQVELITEGMKNFPSTLPPEFRRWLEQNLQESANRT
jgi:hypothetical protein